MPVTTWKDNNGHIIRIADMSNYHVTNVLTMLNRLKLTYLLTGEKLTNFNIQSIKAFEKELDKRGTQFDPIPTDTPSLFGDTQ